MKTNFTPKFCVFIFAMFLTSQLSLVAQVGINTTSPNGILDVNSSTTGIVLPRLALTATNVMAPAVNPQSGNIPIGTTVYNTNNTSNGINDVYKGIYVWDGSQWVNQFPLKHAEIFKQINHLRSRSNAGFESIHNLDNESFTAKYSGTYKIELSVNFGGGHIRTDYAVNVATQSGDFRFIYDTESGTETKLIPAKAISTDGATQYYLIWEQHKVVYYETLRAGQSYNFSLEFNQDPSPEFEDNGNSGSGFNGGAGFVGFDIPCSVEFTYLGN